MYDEDEDDGVKPTRQVVDHEIRIMALESVIGQLIEILDGSGLRASSRITFHMDAQGIDKRARFQQHTEDRLAHAAHLTANRPSPTPPTPFTD